jgi:hypothetical protein
MAKKRNNECADRQSQAAFAPRQHAAHPPPRVIYGRLGGRAAGEEHLCSLSLWRKLSSCNAWAKISAARAHATLARGARWENLHETFGSFERRRVAGLVHHPRRMSVDREMTKVWLCVGGHHFFWEPAIWCRRQSACAALIQLHFFLSYF